MSPFSETPYLRAPVKARMLPINRQIAQISIDFALALTAWLTAYVARFNFDLPAMQPYLHFESITVLALLQIAGLLTAGNYSRLWRYTSLRDLRALLAGVALGTLFVLIAVLLLPSLLSAPRGVLLTQPFVFTILIGGARVARRVSCESARHVDSRSFGEPIIVVGAGSAAAALLAEFHRSRRWRAVALLDDRSDKYRRVMHGVRVTGTTDDFARESTRLQVRKAVIAIPSASDTRRDELARRLCAQGAEVYTLPRLDSLPADVIASSMRRVRPEELLRRTPVVVDREALRRGVEGKTVLVTGAGGSIGSELCRQVAELQPELLVLYELNEFALYQIAEELKEGWALLKVITAIGDVKDAARVAVIMSCYRPQIVVHAAAYKHVPMMEQVNTFEVIRNNAFGSMVVAQAAVDSKVEQLLVVSTDKAVNPTSVMGATKRLAEVLVQEVVNGHPIKLSIVRFGNVLASAGSVIPKFVEQIQRGGPVTVTHPEMTRYFMSIPEAAQLVILSSSVGRGGEIFVLNMGEPVRIVELAEDLIRLMGQSRQDIDIVFTGLRPGEKLYEELLCDQETTTETMHPRISVAHTRATDGQPCEQFVNWVLAKPMRTDLEVRQLLQRLIPEYQPDRRLHVELQQAA